MLPQILAKYSHNTVAKVNPQKIKEHKDIHIKVQAEKCEDIAGEALTG